MAVGPERTGVPLNTNGPCKKGAADVPASREIGTPLETMQLATARCRQIMEATSEAVLLLDAAYRISDANRAFLDSLGYEIGEIRRRRISSLYERESRDFHFASSRHLSFEVNFVSRDGRRIPYLYNRSVLRGIDGGIDGYVCFLTDLTEQKNIERDKHLVERRFRFLYENAVQGMFQATWDGRFLSVNPAFGRMVGYGTDELLAMTDVAAALYRDPRDREKMLAILEEHGEVRDYEQELRRRDGSPLWTLAHVRRARDEEGRPIVEGILVDNTARKLAQQELEKREQHFRYQAIHDNLTCLYNTRYMYPALERLVEETHRSGTPFSLIFIDIDAFKKVVDTHGHLEGSRTLQEVAAVIRDTLEEPAFGVSYGGDEFVVVLPGHTKDQALEAARGLRRRMIETVYLAGSGRNIRLTASFGIATVPDDAGDVEGVLALADKALFSVKQGGKDGIRTTVDL